LANTLDERSMQEDVHRIEIVALRMQVETLQAQLAQAGEAIKAAEECRDVTVRALSGKESELARLAAALDEHSTHEAVQKNEITARDNGLSRACSRRSPTRRIFFGHRLKKPGLSLWGNGILQAA
jgi:hypothetical protein